MDNFKFAPLFYSSNILKAKATNPTKRAKTNSITGDAKNNSLVGTSGNDTLNGGKGNDTLTGGKGKDVFIYSSGKDVITDYTAGQDTIKISSGSVSGYSVSGSDLIFKVGTGNLKILGGKTKTITIKDSKNKISVYKNGVLYDNTKIEKSTSAKITSNFVKETFSADSLMVTLDASSDSNGVEIIGNKKNNKIIGGKGNDTLNGGAGNDTLTGGSGEDVFIYEAGNDVIADYTENEDTILLSAGVEIVSYSVSGKDLVLKTGNKGSIKVKNGKTQAVKISDGENFVTYQNGLLYDGEDTSISESVSITSVYGKEFNASNLSVTNIDASTRNAVIKITGNDNDNKIVGTKKNDTINGGAGDDTIYGSAGNDILTGGEGADVFIYADGDGRDTITDYGAGDVISLAGNYDIDYVYKTVKGGGGNSTLKIGKGIITIKDSANKSVTLIGANGEASIANNKSFFAVKDVPDIDAVYVTVPAETITVGGGTKVTVYDTVTVHDTVAVTVPPVTLPAETVTVYETVTVHDTVEVTLPAETVNVTLPAETVYGGGKNIKGTSRAETLYGTAGNDTVSLGGGKDVYIYTGGFDIIQDYTAGDDKISIGTNSVSNYGVIGSDGVFFIADGILKLVGAKDKKVTIISGGKENEYDLTVTSTTPTVPEGKTVTLEASSGDFNLTNYNTTVDETYQHIDASKVTNSIKIYGDDRANIIRAGRNGGNIYAGKGDDTVYFGDGNDTFTQYQEDRGDKVIYNYRAEDRIYFGNGTVNQFSNFSFNNNDVIMNLKNGGTITLKDAKDKSIKLDGFNSGELTATFGKVSFSNGTISLNKDYTGYFNMTYYAEEITNIDASAATGTIDLRADTGNNVIKAAKGGSNIYAGKGDDTIYCGNGADTIRFYQYDGNETVYNIGNEDQIILNSCTAQNVSVKGNDVVITTSSNETITLKEGTGKRIFITGQNWQTYTSTSARVIENIWFLEDDNNFVGSDIDSITEQKFAVTQIQTETENIFAQDKTFVAYNTGEQK